MLDRFAQALDPGTGGATSPGGGSGGAGTPGISIDLGGLGDAIRNAFTSHMPEVGDSIWHPLSSWLTDGLRATAQATYVDLFGAIPDLMHSIPAALTYNLPAYQAIAANPVPVAVGGATLAIVLLGIRTILGSMIGRDNVITHVTGRLIPAVFLALAFPVLLIRGIELINQAAQGVAMPAVVGLFTFPMPYQEALVLPYAVLWLMAIWYGLKLLKRVGYGLFRFVLAMVFSPVAIILWAIPQTEWVTWFWLRELIGWGTSPLLVVVCLAIAVPVVTGQTGFLAAAAFGLAGLEAAHDVVGLFSMAHGGGGSGSASSVIGYGRMAIAAGSGGAAAGPMINNQTLADMYGAN